MLGSLQFPTTGSAVADGGLAFVLFMVGIFMLLKGGNKYGGILMAAAIYWAWSTFDRFF